MLQILLAAEAIAANVESEEWQLGEIQVGIAELDSGQAVRHEKVRKGLKFWGKPRQNPEMNVVWSRSGTESGAGRAS